MNTSTPDTHALFERLQGPLRGLIQRRVGPADAEDVLQDVFERLLTQRHHVRDEEKIVGWLFRVAQNAATDHARQASRRRALLEGADLAPEPPHEESGPSADLAAGLYFFIDALPEPYRQALIWTELEGVSQKEAAARAGISHSGMKSRVQRGRQMVRGALEACCRVELDARNRVIDYTPKSATCDAPTCGCPGDER